jgi:hypothetical protein
VFVVGRRSFSSNGLGADVLSDFRDEKSVCPDLAEGFVLIPFGGFLLPVADFIWKLSSTKTDTRC